MSTSQERLEGILKAKRTGNPIHTKAEKEAMASFKNVLTDVLGKEIPIDLARAIFRLDLFNVMKYCPILDDGLQDKYDELLNELPRIKGNLFRLVEIVDRTTH